ncbi:cryptochrome/photolyase family protein [Halomonas sp. QX-2]|uniref:Cryptochrome/photolyase family protein n=1 Tax=Vreelandella sedimenti TaxID=2729618 RepID=A0A7Z0N608_9GAMM|nr:MULTISPECIES: cryptochrome/photolyase family protein [Halomonas]NYT72283.1 cryptochrome/photolyase family protein [Halomonas sedimenti]|tara:strand:+ start:26296 stop:27894 length:1599 start_codon:yes stop_codon:yes gene_type:complete
MSKPLLLVLGDQLSFSLTTLQDAPANAVVALCEVAEEARYVPHHIHKIGLFLAAMRHFAQALREKGFQVHYSALDDADNCHSLIEEAERIAQQYGCAEIRVARPGEWRLWETMQQRENATIPWRLLEDERFFTTPDDFSQWASGRKQLRLEYFYREQRKRTGYLMEGDEPIGGKWNFDHDNRQPIKAALDFPELPQHRQDALTQEALNDAKRHFGDHMGSLDNFNLPVTRRQALVDLHHFIDHGLADFGRYQDAISDSAPYLYHSRLSAAMNIGLLSPHEVCEAAEQRYHDSDVPINAVEGFIRQILGWREYVRGLYWTQMPSYKGANQLGFERDLPAFYWDADTDMRCLQSAIQMTIDNSYAHHIQRLMVTGNFALLCGVTPEALCDWYLAVYADASEWVELPNTLGMVLHADGGLMGSKPYCASGKYIDKMSDHCQLCRYSPKQVTGAKACPFNSLYWHFLETNAERLSKNPRMKLIYGSLNRMADEKREAIRQQAEHFLDQLETSPGYGQPCHTAGYAATTSNTKQESP